MSKLSPELPRNYLPGITAVEFVNFTCAEVIADLQSFIARLRAINPSARVVLTVSPVPLIATYENRHVLVATTYSKAVLRAAAAEAIRDDPLSDYFPSFELITGNQTRGRYFESDLRTVSSTGVEHAMRLFLKRYVGTGTAPRLAEELVRETKHLRELVCDEEAIDAGGYSAGRAAQALPCDSFVHLLTPARAPLRPRFLRRKPMSPAGLGGAGGCSVSVW